MIPSLEDRASLPVCSCPGIHTCCQQMMPGVGPPCWIQTTIYTHTPSLFPNRAPLTPACFVGNVCNQLRNRNKPHSGSSRKQDARSWRCAVCRRLCSQRRATHCKAALLDGATSMHVERNRRRKRPWRRTSPSGRNTSSATAHIPRSLGKEF